MKKLINIYIAVMMLLAASPLFADGFIVLPERHPVLRTPYPLEVRYHNVDVSIDGLVAETSIDQEFVNPTNFRLEGYYFFPIPKNAVIRKFSMFIDNKETQAELLDAAKARAIYEDIVRKQLDPALLEYSDRSMFKVRIFPIEPRSTKRVKIKYIETLTRESGSIEYLYPLNTEKFSARELDDVRINVTIKSDSEIKNIYCPTHETKTTRNGKDSAAVLYSDKRVKPDSDFKLYYSTGESDVGIIFRAYRERSDDGFFFMNLSPKIDVGTDVIPRDIVFVLDTSGSMAGEKIEQAKKALRYCVSHLNKGDRFQIVRFSTEADTLFDTVKDSDRGNIDRANQFIDSFKAIGGTNIEEALRKSFESLGRDSRSKLVVFITDGKPTIGETEDDKLLDLIKKTNSSSVRIFTFGIGYDVNTHLLDRLTDLTRAYRTYLAPRDNLEEKVSSFFAKIHSPVLTDLSLKFTNVKGTKIYPKDLPDLYAGSSLSLFGRYTGDGVSSVTLEGKVKGNNQKYSYSFDFPREDKRNDYIPPLWAIRRVGSLVDMMRLSGENKELIDEIVQLSRAYGIITPYTSYLILEDETRKSERHAVSDDHLTLRNALPAAPEAMKEYKKDFYSLKAKSGEESVNASRSVQGLSRADNAQQARDEQDATKFYSGKGTQNQSMSSKIRNTAGQVFYNAGNFWIDPRIQNKKNPKVVRVQFASQEYFDLLAKDTSVSQYLSIGRNVRFLFKDTVYEVHE
jgi:Ca-activated chloride channel homolog